jgi:hypothetical protein
LRLDSDGICEPEDLSLLLLLTRELLLLLETLDSLTLLLMFCCGFAGDKVFVTPVAVNKTILRVNNAIGLTIGAIFLIFIKLLLCCVVDNKYHELRNELIKITIFDNCIFS